MKRSSIGLRVIGLTWLLSSIASAQDYQSYNYAPVPDLRTEQLFEPVDVSNYGSGPPRPEGWFGTYEMTYMSLLAADQATVGTAGSSLNTGVFDSEFSPGSRLELGFMEENVGLLFSASYFGKTEQSIWGGGGQTEEQLTTAPSVMQSGTLINTVVIDGLGFAVGGFAVARELTVTDKTEAYSGELMRTWRVPRRKPPQAYDPTFEFMAGLRYFRVNSNFMADGIYQGSVVEDEGPPIIPGPVDEDIRWWSSVQNHMLLPQIGSRFVVQRGPWEVGLEGRGFMGVCVQDIKQEAQLGPNFVYESYLNGIGEPDLTLTPSQISTNSVNSQWRTAFAMGGEMRVNGKYYVTRRIAVNGGATAVFLNNCIGRANQATDYTIRANGSAFGLSREMTYQDFLSAGVSLGVVINR